MNFGLVQGPLAQQFCSGWVADWGAVTGMRRTAETALGFAKRRNLLIPKRKVQIGDRWRAAREMSAENDKCDA